MEQDPKVCIRANHCSRPAIWEHKMKPDSAHCIWAVVFVEFSLATVWWGHSRDHSWWEIRVLTDREIKKATMQPGMVFLHLLPIHLLVMDSCLPLQVPQRSVYRDCLPAIGIFESNDSKAHLQGNRRRCQNNPLPFHPGGSISRPAYHKDAKHKKTSFPPPPPRCFVATYHARESSQTMTLVPSVCSEHMARRSIITLHSSPFCSFGW